MGPKAHYTQYLSERGSSDVTAIAKINFDGRAEALAKVQSNKKPARCVRRSNPSNRIKNTVGGFRNGVIEPLSVTGLRARVSAQRRGWYDTSLIYPAPSWATKETLCIQLGPLDTQNLAIRLHKSLGLV
ncbi:hypothetical protein EVAR_62312_1 [Eumeta japonica]|uniref:Uncharacterized protein n=1 Tax=Eumeta variegata TaxID=151549 RepID=A0A4C1ZET8_EUMVA|nr:hypothetical protein EVAR_62312_1 [Eumeta japonica]